MIPKRGRLPMICGIGSIACLLIAFSMVQFAPWREGEFGVNHHTWLYFSWMLGSVLILGFLYGVLAAWKHSRIWSFVVLLIVAMFILFVATGDSF
jgi:hypothetical protein